MKFLDKVGLSYWTSKIKSCVNTKIEDLKTLLSKDIEKKQDKLTAGSNIQIDSNNTISATDTVYTHPDKHKPSEIDTDANNRFVTDTEKTTWNNKQDSLTAGTNVTITGTTISAKDTIYDDTALKTRITAVENREDKDTTYSAGTNVTIDADNKINAKDTTYTAGTNVTITGTTISSKDTTYDVATTTTDGLMSSADKTKLNGVEAGAEKNNVTSTDIANWNNKVDKVSGKQLSTNDYTTVEKNKLAGIQAGAQVNAVTSVNGQTGAVTTPNTTYDAATTTTNGLMSSADKVKLNGIENEANKVEIVNNLEETLSGKALDAYQGYLLSQSLDTVFQNVDSGKGLVANAIIDKGGSGVSNDSTFQELANGVINIKSGGELDANLVNSNGEFGFNGDLIIPSEIDGISVTSISVYAFAYLRGLTSITIPNSVTSIGDNAFNNCSGLTSITIPNSVTKIDNNAFAGCTGLTSITIPNSVTKIVGYTFQNCTGLTSITIPNSVTSIGSFAFYNCTGLTSITIPNSVTSIDNSTFKSCSGLTSITIPNSVTKIDNNAFQNCSGLTSITIPNSVTKIGDRAFNKCTGLTNVTIPNSVTKIGGYTFAGCTNLATAYVPDGLTYLSNAFPSTTNIIKYTPGGADDPTTGGN